MLKKHPFNRAESLRVYNELKEEMFQHQCYNNVFTTVVRMMDKFDSREWKVAYGYIRIYPHKNIWARHGFIVNKKGEAIDPTYFTHPNEVEGELKEHTSFHIFNDKTTYAISIKLNDDMPNLVNPLKEKEQDFVKWAQKHGMLLIE